MLDTHREGTSLHLGQGHIQVVLFVVFDPFIGEVVNKAPCGFPLLLGMAFILNPPLHYFIPPPTELGGGGGWGHKVVLLLQWKAIRARLCDEKDRCMWGIPVSHMYPPTPRLDLAAWVPFGWLVRALSPEPRRGGEGGGAEDGAATTPPALRANFLFYHPRVVPRVHKGSGGGGGAAVPQVQSAGTMPCTKHLSGALGAFVLWTCNGTGHSLPQNPHTPIPEIFRVCVIAAPPPPTTTHTQRALSTSTTLPLPLFLPLPRHRPSQERQAQNDLKEVVRQLQTVDDRYNALKNTLRKERDELQRKRDEFGQEWQLANAEVTAELQRLQQHDVEYLRAEGTRLEEEAAGIEADPQKVEEYKARKKVRPQHPCESGARGTERENEPAVHLQLRCRRLVVCFSDLPAPSNEAPRAHQKHSRTS